MKRKLGSIEQSWMMAGQFAPLAAVAVLRLKNGPEPEVLRQGLATLQQRQPLLNVKIVRQGSRYYFEPAPNVAEIPLKLLNRQDDQQWQTVANHALNSTIDDSSAPLMNCTYLYQPGENAPVELVLAHHHSIMDAASGMHFYDQLLSFCAGVDCEQPAAGVPMSPALDQMLPPEMSGLKRYGRLMNYFWRQMVDEFQFRRQLDNGRRATIHPTARCMILTRKLDSAATKALVRASRRQRVTMNNVLLAAMLLAVRKHLYQDQARPLRALSFADLRPYLHPPLSNETLGCYISMLRHTINLPQNGDFWTAVQTVQEKASQATRRGDKFIAALMSRPLMQMLIRYQPFRMGAIAVSYPGVVQLQPTYGQVQLTGLHAFISNNRIGPEYTAFAKILSGELSWDFLYLDTDMEPEMAETIASEINGILRRAGTAETGT